MSDESTTDLVVQNVKNSLKNVLEHKSEGCTPINHERVVEHLATQSSVVTATFRKVEATHVIVSALAKKFNVQPAKDDNDQRDSFFSGKLKAFGVPAIIISSGCGLGIILYVVLEKVIK